MLDTGTMLGDRYEIEGRIGQGGMSYVYRAQDKKLGRVVAIKVLREEFSGDEEFIRKFKNEARAAAKLSHPNIVAAYDVVDDGDLHYIVMELVEGITLKNYIARKGQLSNKETIGIALQAAEGIGEAHKKGIIHRDIKPQNMIISKDGKVKVADFGIAKAVTGETINAAVIGSVHYISPEQARSGVADARSDIYSLGISMYEMITGRVPYEGDNTVNVVIAHLSEAMVPPSVYKKDIYPALAAIITKACRKHPEDRYQSCAELIADLRRCVREPEGNFVKLSGTVSASEQGDSLTLKDEGISSGTETGKEKNESRDPGQDERSQKGTSDGQTGSNEQIVSGKNGESLNAGEPGADTGAGDAGTAKNGAEPEEAVNTGASEIEGSVQIQRLMKYGSIAAAAVILIIIIMVAGKVTGVFNAYSPLQTEQSEQTEAESSGQEEITLSRQESTGNAMMVLMPELLRMSVSDAVAKASSSGLSLDTSETAFSDVFNEGIVMSQEPQSGEEVKPGDTVYVTVSLGNQITYTLNHITGKTIDEAEQMLSDAGISVEEVKMEASETAAEGTVTAWEAAEPGEEVISGESVILTVSSGKDAATVHVPSLHNLTQDAAQRTIQNAGLAVGPVTQQASELAAGLVVDQSPAAGESVQPGTAVSLVISTGSETGADAPESAMLQGEGPGAASANESGEADSRYYYGSIDTVSHAGMASGPNAQGETMNIEIRLMQRGSNSYEYITLGELKAVPLGTEFPVSFPSIRGIYGVTTGEIQVVNSDTGEMLETFDITFAPR